jgi:hypothetical protein
MITAAIVSTGVDTQARAKPVSLHPPLSAHAPQDSHGFYVVEVASGTADKWPSLSFLSQFLIYLHPLVIAIIS